MTRYDNQWGKHDRLNYMTPLYKCLNRILIMRSSRKSHPILRCKTCYNLIRTHFQVVWLHKNHVLSGVTSDIDSKWYRYSPKSTHIATEMCLMLSAHTYKYIVYNYAILACNHRNLLLPLVVLACSTFSH